MYSIILGAYIIQFNHNLPLMQILTFYPYPETRQSSLNKLVWAKRLCVEEEGVLTYDIVKKL